VHSRARQSAQILAAADITGTNLMVDGGWSSVLPG
jgi:hypothetical protein